MSWLNAYKNIMPQTLNGRAWLLVDQFEKDAAKLKVMISDVIGARVVDCSGGGLSAGLLLAKICLSDLADVSLSPGENGPMVQVYTDDPVRACLASQYAGWQINVEKYFAMGSGPMRAVAAREEIFKHIKGQEISSCIVGVLETKKTPTEAVVNYLKSRLPEEVTKYSLVYAPAASIPGSIQVVARSVETALHKLHELKFDVSKVISGYGVAPLPSVAKDELAAIGRTNDAILYGGHVTLWLRCEDSEMEQIGPLVPSSSSKDHGELFRDLFSRYGDFYKIDPLLFSPAMITMVNLNTGRQMTFGKMEPDLLKRSFTS